MARQIEERLLTKPAGVELLDIVDAYDIERATGPDVIENQTTIKEYLNICHSIDLTSAG